MSASPKYSYTTYASEAQARADREAEERRVADEKRRAAEIERQRREQLEQRRRQLASELMPLQNALQELRGSSAAQYCQREMRALERSLDQQARAVASASEIESMRSVPATLARLRQDLNTAAARAAAAQATDRCSAQLTLARRQLAGIDRVQWDKFAPAAAFELEQEIAEAERHFAAGRVDVALKSATGACEHQARAQEQVSAAYEQWLKQREEAATQIEQIEAELAGLRADARVTSSLSANLVIFATKMIALHELLLDDQFDAVKETCQQLRDYAAATIAEADQRDRAEQRRRLVVNALLEAIPACGMFITAQPQAADPFNPDAPLIIPFRSIAGHQASVSVALDGPNTWDMSGFPQRQYTAASGEAFSDCDLALQAINEIRARAAANSGVHLCEPTWRGKDPNPPRRTGARKAIAGNQHTQRRNG